QWNAVYVEHNDGSTAWYGHLKTGTLTSKNIGQTVLEGEYLGIVGSSGCSSNPHLHFEIRTGNSTVIEPYSGSCNNTTGVSWWKDQKPYWEPRLNLLMTHLSNPGFSGFCPSDEDPDFNYEVEPGTSVRFAAYYHDQTMGEATDYRIRDPLGNLFGEWSHNSPTTYSRSWWYWIDVIPENAVEGIWTFEADFIEQSVVHEFLVGSEVSSASDPGESPLRIFPNPVEDELGLLDLPKGEKMIRLFDAQGRTVLQQKRSDIMIDLPVSSLGSGIYFLEIQVVGGEKTIVEKIVKI
ncbi:MAG: peptidoglycan DD-metalloendopeptidase family protein, partial [Saprospiraceae bacterium]|nr:peptidoglycan DD-metalloendopeptidase family protein [Saprospiraceae bacterium]